MQHIEDLSKNCCFLPLCGTLLNIFSQVYPIFLTNARSRFRAPIKTFMETINETEWCIFVRLHGMDAINPLNAFLMYEQDLNSAIIGPTGLGH